jgi:hypothetical protein
MTGFADEMNPHEQLKDVKSRMAQLGICTNVAVQQQLLLSERCRQKASRQDKHARAPKKSPEEFFTAIQSRFNPPLPLPPPALRKDQTQLGRLTLHTPRRRSLLTAAASKQDAAGFFKTSFKRRNSSVDGKSNAFEHTPKDADLRATIHSMYPPKHPEKLSPNSSRRLSIFGTRSSLSFSGIPSMSTEEETSPVKTRPNTRRSFSMNNTDDIFCSAAFDDSTSSIDDRQPTMHDDNDEINDASSARTPVDLAPVTMSPSCQSSSQQREPKRKNKGNLLLVSFSRNQPPPPPPGENYKMLCYNAAIKASGIDQHRPAAAFGRRRHTAGNSLQASSSDHYYSSKTSHRHQELLLASNNNHCHARSFSMR